MSAHEHLSPQQFYHASPHEIGEGEELQPPERTGMLPNFGMSRSHRVYMSDNEGDADTWGNMLTMSSGKTSHIYEVKPRGMVESNYLEDMEGMVEHRAPAATVVRRVRAAGPPHFG